MNKIGKLTAGTAAVAAALILAVNIQASAHTTATSVKGGASPADTARANSVSSLTTTVTAEPTWILQCPAAGCNHGFAHPGDVITDFCYVAGQDVNGNPIWDLVINRTAPDSNVAGWVPEYYLVNKSQTTAC